MEETKDYCYLDPEEVGENVVLQAMDSKDTFLIEKMKTLKEFIVQIRDMRISVQSIF